MLSIYIFEVNLSYLKQCFITLVKWFVVQFANQLSYSCNRKAYKINIIYKISFTIPLGPQVIILIKARFQQIINTQQNSVQKPNQLSIHLQLFFKHLQPTMYIWSVREGGGACVRGRGSEGLCNLSGQHVACQ